MAAQHMQDNILSFSYSSTAQCTNTISKKYRT